MCVTQYLAVYVCDTVFSCLCLWDSICLFVSVTQYLGVYVCDTVFGCLCLWHSFSRFQITISNNCNNDTTVTYCFIWCIICFIRILCDVVLFNAFSGLIIVLWRFTGNRSSSSSSNTACLASWVECGTIYPLLWSCYGRARKFESRPWHSTRRCFSSNQATGKVFSTEYAICCKF